MIAPVLKSSKSNNEFYNSLISAQAISNTRIDGMYFVGADLRLPSSYPLSGSSAELLEHELSTLDFVWRAPDGSEVLTHWNAFTYFQGDMLAHLGVIRWMGLVLGVPWRTGRHVARRIAKLVRGKTEANFAPHLNPKVHVVILNADKVVFTGNKLKDKTYYRHSGWRTGIKAETAEKLLARKPEDILRKAIYGMLPKNRLGRQLFKKLFVYEGAEHPHEAQKPEKLEL